MKLLTRLSATLNAGADRAVSRIENHDAIAAAAVREAREALATARTRHARLLRDAETRRERLAALEGEATRWGERARASAAAGDEADALACLERRRTCRGRLAEAGEALEVHGRLERETAARLATLEARLADIVRRRDALRSRDSIARAGEVLDALAPRDGGDGLEAVFERWEVSIAGRGPLEIDMTGMADGAMPVGLPDEDPLARRHDARERDASLRAELAALLENDDGTGIDAPDAHRANDGADR